MIYCTLLRKSHSFLGMWWARYSLRVVPLKFLSFGRSGMSEIGTRSGESHAVRQAVQPFGASMVSTRAFTFFSFASSATFFMTPFCCMIII